MVFARRAYLIAGIYGLLVLTPQFFMEAKTGRDFPPEITHPEYFYGFVGVAWVFQLIFILISRDPVRYRPLMPITWLEKLAFGVPCIILYATGRLATQMLGAGLLDMLIGAFFVAAYLKTPERAS